MNIFVCVSHVPDTTTKVQVGGDGKTIDPSGVTYILNPYDEYAVEAGLQLKEARGEGEVTIVCVGPDAVKETIRKGLAMGADKGLHIVSEPRDGFGTARAIADALKDKAPDVVFCGRQSIDYDGWQMSGLLGEMLEIPSVSVAAKLEIADDGSFAAERDIEGGSETITSKLPAVISAQKGLNDPRYPKLQGIMQAKRKPIEDVEPAPYENRVEVIEMSKPPIKEAGKIVGEGPDAVKELVRLLHEEAKVI
ncbi:electron transfer flavoprotein subunit beta/FixA family protein [bacterium]|nr:electron transfer flavoprotein subunit beta/FixA family protein [bacterium]